jgi:hypothetical protein
MKYKITDNKLESVIFLYLDNQDFIPIEKGNKIYFANSEGDEYSQIRYDKDDGWCYVHSKLVDEISRFFSLEESDSKHFIGIWVENTLQMRVTQTFLIQIQNHLQLRIPSN